MAVPLSTPSSEPASAQPPAPIAVPPAAGLSAAARLQLMWLASPALPVGGFSYSEAFESAVDAGRVGDEAQARQWLLDQLQLTLARSDLAVVAQAVPAWQAADLARVQALNDWVLHTRETSEFRLQAEQMGRSLVEWLRNRGGGAQMPAGDMRLAACATLAPAPSWPIAFALAVAQCLPVVSPEPAAGDATTDATLREAALREALLSFAFGWAENMTQTAIKAVPLGQSAGQRILQALVDAIPAAIEHALSLSDGERQAFSPMLAILSAQHETQYSRLFRS